MRSSRSGRFSSASAASRSLVASWPDARAFPAASALLDGFVLQFLQLQQHAAKVALQRVLRGAQFDRRLR